MRAGGGAGRLTGPGPGAALDLYRAGSGGRERDGGGGAMAILDRNFAAHFAVRLEGVIKPFCQSWRSTWNWTMEPDHVTCPHCRTALERQAQASKDEVP